VFVINIMVEIESLSIVKLEFFRQNIKTMFMSYKHNSLRSCNNINT